MPSGGISIPPWRDQDRADFRSALQPRRLAADISCSIIHWVNDLKPDMVVVTGDLITGGYRYAHRIATILSHLKAAARRDLHLRQSRLQHLRQDATNGEGQRRADYLEKCLKDRGLIVLRNSTRCI